MNYNSKKQLDSALKNVVYNNLGSAESRLNKILFQLPELYFELIEQAFNYKRIPKEYLLSCILFTFSTSIGLTFFTRFQGYRNYANAYFTILGSRGDAKSEAMKIATQPLKKVDDKDYQVFLDENEMSRDEEDSPKRRQVLIQNATIEATHKIHLENPNSVGIVFDELYGLIDKMSNPNSRDGIQWRNFFLEGYTNGCIDVSRKSTDSFRIPKSYPTLIGGLQIQFVPQLFANGNLESGFVDRMLFTPKITNNSQLTKGEIDVLLIKNYNDCINNVLDYKRQSENPNESKKQFGIEMTKEAENVLFKYVQDLIRKQEIAPSIIREYMAKMQISIHKLCIIVFIISNATDSTFRSKLTLENIELAIDLNEFYFMNFKSMIDKGGSNSSRELNVDSIIELAKQNGAPQKAVSEITGLNKSTISRRWQSA